MGDVFNITFVGLAVVFLALIALLVIIVIFTNVVNNARKRNVSNEKTIDMDEASILEAGKRDNVKNADNISDDELIAVLTAAVMSSLETAYKSKIIVKSFRRIPQETPIWNAVGRGEQIAAKLL